MKALLLVRSALIVAAAGLPLAVLCSQPAAVTTPASGVSASSVRVENLRLGRVAFPTSGAAEAQPHFLHGIAALHSFWYEEALEAFGRAAAIDPDFAMAHWGEAMCHYRPYRPGADEAAGRRALAKIADSPRLTERERGFIAAARALFRGARGIDPAGFADAMARVHAAHPQDQEAAAFYALALLGRRGRENLDKAGVLAQEIYRANPQHPGAAHYIIHSYDDPAHARRALEAAHHYAKIAPDAPHALHMPSHIFVQLGMWREAFMSNDAGWAASVDYVRRKELSPTLRDYHNLHWLIYASLQQGRYARARELVEAFARMRAAGELASYSSRYINEAVANFVIETRSWDRAEALAPSEANATAATINGREVELCGAPSAPPPAKTAPPALADLPVFVRTYAAAARGAPLPDAATASNAAGLARIRALQIRGLVQARTGEFSAALEALREAATLEGKTPKPPGPPSGKPAHELLGEVLLQAGKPAEALTEFLTALERHPNRALSLLGRARAEAAANQRTAARKSYAALLEIWAEADADLPELLEAREFLKAG